MTATDPEAARSGLFAADRPVPLEAVRIDVRLVGRCSEVTVVQRFRNAEGVPIEAVYLFPLDEGAAVCGFDAMVGDRTIHGRVEERDEAFEAYDEALAAGHGAFLLDQERPNVFTASVGNLEPGATVALRIRYVALAPFEGDALRLMVPTTVSPRYFPEDPAPQPGEPDSERLNPERWTDVPYGLTLCVEIAEGAGALRRVESPSHPVRVALEETSTTVELAQANAVLDRDFVLLVERAEPHRTEARVAAEADGTRIVMVDFRPDLGDLDDAGAQEVIFLLDCSGSMLGTSIAQARQALDLCVRALAPGDTFDIVRFGSDHERLWRRPRPYDEASFREALATLESTDADLGGTEIMTPLREILEARADPERSRQVLVLTDGQVGNEAEVIALAEEHAGSARIFTFGIGAGVSEHLVRGLARASRGACEMVYPGERIEPKVLRTFNRLRTPVLPDLRVDWGGARVLQGPAETPPVFAGDGLTVLARVESGAPAEVSLLAGDRTWTAAVDLEHAESGGPLPALWARERIADLEQGRDLRRGSSQRRGRREERRRAELVELGKRYGLASAATSWVAVEEREVDAKTTKQAELRKVPIALTTGWGGAVAAGAFPQMATGLAASMRAATLSAPSRKGTIIGSVLSSIADRLSGRPARASHAMLESEPSFDLFSAAPADAAPPSPPPPPSRAARDALFALLGEQGFDGSWSFEDTADLLPDDLREAADRGRASHDARIVMTILVLHALARDFGDRRGEWIGAATKAERWLAGQPDVPPAEELLATL